MNVTRKAYQNMRTECLITGAVLGFVFGLIVGASLCPVA